MTLALRRPHVLFLLAAANLAGCATSPAPKAVLGPPPAAPASEPHVEMAPIPNPTPQREEPRRVRAAPVESSPQKAPPVPPPPPQPTINPLRAAQLRGAGLEQLNRGSINKALDLLKEANQLDPGNALIKHDLDRALRIAKALHANH